MQYPLGMSLTSRASRREATEVRSYESDLQSRGSAVDAITTSTSHGFCLLILSPTPASSGSEDLAVNNAREPPHMFSWRAILATLSICVGLYAAHWGAGGQSQQALGGRKRPNIVMILTDDQDLHMDSLAYMPHTQKLIAEQGTSFSNHFCTVALCCPSRVTLWTGKAAHNTNVTDVNPPHGWFAQFPANLVQLPV